MKISAKAFEKGGKYIFWSYILVGILRKQETGNRKEIKVKLKKSKMSYSTK